MIIFDTTNKTHKTYSLGTKLYVQKKLTFNECPLLGKVMDVLYSFHSSLMDLVVIKVFFDNFIGTFPNTLF